MKLISQPYSGGNMESTNNLIDATRALLVARSDQQLTVDHWKAVQKALQELESSLEGRPVDAIDFRTHDEQG